MARKILLADDSVTAQNMGRRILTDAGYEVVTVNNGSAAFKKIAEQLPELIVLDVYMPGYSGLEVCQRLKETKETASIPILLTVGKLEPFKPEEARRVKADAFIVKPFEASELLTALTRLEDKIVPRPTSEKKGSFAKVWAALEETGDSKAKSGKGEKFGDKETGWKDRLIIPTGEPKAEEPAEEATPAGKKSKGSKKEKEAAEVSIPGSVPADITPEEVAAIAAAAAAFENKEQPAEAVAKTETAEELPSMPVVAPEPEAAPAETKVEEVAVAASEAIAEEKEVPTAKSEPEVVPAVAEEKVEAKTEAVAGQPVETKAEEAPAKVEEAEPVVASVSPDKVEKARVARWIAHEVPLEPTERNSILDEEMRAAGAVLQAATGGLDFSAETLLAKESVAAVAEPAPVVEEAPAPVEEPVAAKVETPAEPEPEKVEAVAEKVEEPVAPKEDALAAAASASATTVDAVATESVSAAAESAPAIAAEKSQPEAELAAAWAQWKEIRETVVNPQVASKSGESVEAAVPESAVEIAAAAASDNPAAIANIVDNMLAELKPKLMEEIARKLASEKK